MRPSFALEKNREAIRAAVGRSRAENPRVFGSVLRGEDKEGSDIDILVDALPGATLFDLGGLQMDLQEILGAPVDLVTPAELPKRIRAKIIAEAAPI
ncbi:nucleotidyltransferase family protein [Methylocystis heyeri]|uniref:Nucleotidyltransferase n=1 Tax=Methylocystis heyeri TaxID=391905 RepID=A0A6B8KHJ6_9HYPH|nr:nucleotidyltransferase family protein [Methylocystis heyeri]QGM47844.1 nucleotidyltransferase [Methylocystis heyeri]